MDAMWLWVLGGGTVAAGFVVATRARPMTLGRALKVARTSGDIQQVVQLIERKPKALQPTAWDQAIQDLWRSYHREAATDLMVEAAHRSDAPIIQYWLRQVMEVEPEIAEARLPADFMLEHFDPEVAASCGRCGSCGCK